MKLIIDKDRKVNSAGTWGTKNENNYEILNFEFPEELEEYNKRIVYYLDDKRVWDAIVYNKAYITNAITKYEKVNAYVWLTKNETITLKYVCDGTEEGNYYFTYDDANYYFTMPEVEGNDELIFDVATSTLKLDNTTIATTSTGTGTELTFETIIDAEEDFRTQLFEMQFYENENADGIVPTPEQVDGFNTMLTAMNNKIAEVNALEQTIGAAERTRQANETTRQNNETTRQENEQTRQSQEAERERRTDEAIADIEDKTAEYNQNAEEKTEAFNTNASQKTNEFNSNYTQKVNDFNANASSKESAFNANASSKTSAFNSNAETKTNAFNTNATNKTNAFNSNATEKTTTFNDNASTKISEFNSNAESKTSTFNDNATQKTTNFDNNASEKTDEFNTNAQEKIDEYDEHIVEYQAQIDELQEEVEELSENMPWNTTEQATEITVDDAAKYSRNKLELFGNTEQASYNGDTMENTVDNTITINNLNITTEKEGIITLNGVPSAGVNRSSSSFIGQTYEIPPGTYYVHYEYISGSAEYNEGYTTGNAIINIRGTGETTSNQIIITANDYETNKYVSKEITVESTISAIQFMTGAHTKFNNLKFRVWWSKSTEENYEPYTGGVPSPNPDYPQDIHVVTGENTIEVQTKNLIDAVLVNDTSTTQNIEKSTNLLLQPGTYTIVWFNKPSTSNANLFSGNNIISVAQVGYYTNKRTFEIEQPTLVTKARSSVNANEKVYCFLVKGTIAPETYTPYYHANYPINLGNIKLCKIDTNQYNIFKNTQGSEHYSSTLIENAWYYIPIFFQEINNADSFNRYTCEGDSSKFFYRMRLNSDIQLVNFNYIQTGLINYGKVNHPARSTNRALFQGFNIGAKDLYLYTDEDSALTLEQFKAKWNEKLQNIPIQVYALKEDRTPVQITDETLIDQLDAIYEHLQLVKGTNNISITASDLAPYMELSYMQDLPAKLDNLDSRLALLE